jgi:hypothetical protein
MALATPAFTERVEPYCAMEYSVVHAARASPDRPGPSCPNSSTHRRGRAVRSSGRAPGRLSIPITGRSAPAAHAANSATLS